MHTICPGCGLSQPVERERDTLVTTCDCREVVWQGTKAGSK